MAARKKAKTKVKRKKTPARKPATRKKTAQVRKKAARKKPAVRRVAPKKKPAARRVPMAQPLLTPMRPAGAPAPIAGEARVGSVTHYYSHLSVAVVRMESGTLRVGDTIHVTGHTSDFRQRVESMQIEHQPVTEVSAGQEFGLSVTEHVRDNDTIYKVTG
jgi:translation elongation factor EF-G